MTEGMTEGIVWNMWRNIHSAWVIFGKLGVRQYYYYTKAEARRLYMEEYRSTIFEKQ